MPQARATQGELDFDGKDAAGYARWQQEQAAWLTRLRREYGFPLGRKVRVKLRDFDREIQGRLGLVELPLQPATSRRVKFRVATFEFEPEEIEYCLRED